MSYIRAKLVDQEDPVTVEHGFHIPEISFEDEPTLDMNLDDEVLDFVLALIAKVNRLGENEALVVWKEIF
ncbi:hypothetical protein ACIO1C_29475 [Streptomyces sp. NPDC087420]|uniref:hypothetical protein n=1 Tax=Streptomyces sp. NPDC087420 TaxID=3365785 RepID=UPI003833CFA8